MKAAQVRLCGVFLAAVSLGLPVAAQTFRSQSSTSVASQNAAAESSIWGRSYLGVNLGRSRNSAACSNSSLLCDDSDRASEVYAGTMIGSFWGAEVSFFNSGRLVRDGLESRAQGLNLSLIGRTRLGSSLGVFGKVGTIYSRSDSSVLGASAVPMAGDQGFGLSYGGGLSYDFTSRLSGRIEWDSHDMRFNGARDAVRSTSLGLQYRY